MSIHSPKCENYLIQLSTAAIDPVDGRLAGVVSRLSDERAHDYLAKVIFEDHGTHAADVALQIWHLAAGTTENEKAQR